MLSNALRQKPWLTTKVLSHSLDIFSTPAPLLFISWLIFAVSKSSWFLLEINEVGCQSLFLCTKNRRCVWCNTLWITLITLHHLFCMWNKLLGSFVSCLERVCVCQIKMDRNRSNVVHMSGKAELQYATLNLTAPGSRPWAWATVYVLPTSIFS